MPRWVAGVPFPTNPPSSRQVIVGGPYRYVRHPMYVAFVAAIVGLALLISRPVLLIYAAAFLLVIAAFVHWYEEPSMASRCLAGGRGCHAGRTDRG